MQVPRQTLAQQSSVLPKPASVKSPPLPVEQVLNADTRLNKKVTVDATAIPVEELLQQVSDTQVTLIAGSNCQGWKLQAHLQQRSLKTLMQALAEMLPGTWRPLTDGHTYRLEMTDAAQRRRQRWWDLFEGERAQALAAQSEAALRWMRSVPDTRLAQKSVELETDEQIANSNAINAMDARHHSFFNLLAPELQQQIARNLNDAPYYSLGNIQFGSDDMDGLLVVPLTSLSTVSQTMIASRVASIRPGASSIHATPGNPADASQYLEGASVSFSNGGFSLNADVSLSDGSSLGAVFGGQPPLVPQMGTIMLDQSNLPPLVAKMGAEAPVTWRELAAFQRSRVWLNTLPAKPQRTNGISRAAQLRHLSAQSGMEYIADYYSHGGHDLTAAAQKKPLQNPLSDELNNLAAWRDVSWKQTPENLCLFRNNRWYRDDRLEVPASLLRKWYIALIAMHSIQPKVQVQPPVNPLKIQMEWEANIVSSLTRWQIMTGLSLFMPEEEKLATLPEKDRLSALGRNISEPTETSDNRGRLRMEPLWFPAFKGTADNISRHYHTTQFYAHLDGTQREALLNGQLSFASLSAEQQQNALHIVSSLQSAIIHTTEKPIRLRLQAVHAEALQGISKCYWIPTRIVIAGPE